MSVSAVQLPSEVLDHPQASFAPWEIDPYGVVSLFDMLDFAAEEFWKLSADLEMFKNFPDIAVDDPIRFSKLKDDIIDAYRWCQRMGMKLSSNKVKQLADMLVVGPTPPQLASVLEDLHERMQEELEGIWFRTIPQEKHEYANPIWLVDTKIYAKYPAAFAEFGHAGMCFGIGENAASVFHLMRIVDFGLRIVAQSLGVPYEAHAWQRIGEGLEKRMREKYQTKTDEWKQKEPFYAQILTDIQAIGRGHRNPHLHEIESKYDDRETRYMLTVVEGFIRHLADNLPQ